MRQPSFSVVTFTVCLLATAGAIVSTTRQYIPRPDENAMGSSPEEYLRQARYQRVPWRTLDSNALSEARRTNRPILLVIGIPESAIARRLDREVFGDVDVSTYISRNFIPIRVDGQHQSEWLSSMLPVTRLRMRFMPEFQAWILDSQGRAFELIAVQQGRPPLGRDVVFSALRRSVELHAAGFPADETPGIAQKLDLEALANPSGPLFPDFEGYTDSMVSRFDANDGIAETAGFQPLQPNLYRYLGDVGRRFEMRRTLDRICLSPMMDVVDGGFFRLAIAPDLQRTTFDKESTSNAEMAATLAHAAALFGDAGYAEAARLTFLTLDTELGNPEGIGAGIVGDENRSMRSQSDSLALSFIRENFPPELRQFILQDLNVGSGDNRQRMPYVTDLKRLMDPRMEQIRAKMSALRPVNRTALVESRFLEVEALAVARMFETARLLGDKALLQRAEARRYQLSAFQSEAFLLREAGSRTQGANLHGYLAFADAMLQSFLATGNAIDFELGFNTLKEARQQFRVPNTELYQVSKTPTAPLSIPLSSAPQVADDASESATATFIRLATAYGRLAEDSVWTGYAAGAIHQVSAAIEGMPSTKLAGYYRASAALKDQVLFAAVGPDAVATANRLARAQPSRIVAPAVGPALASLKERSPGIYLLRGSNVFGPYTPDEARVSMSAHLEIRP